MDEIIQRLDDIVRKAKEVYENINSLQEEFNSIDREKRALEERLIELQVSQEEIKEQLKKAEVQVGIFIGQIKDIAGNIDN